MASRYCSLLPFSVFKPLIAALAVTAAATHAVNANESVHKPVLLEDAPVLEIQPRIVGGVTTNQGAYPFVAAIQSGLGGRVTIDAGAATLNLMSGSTIRAFSAETVICGLYPDANDLCGSGQVLNKVCVMGFDYPRAGVIPETPAQQLARCQRAGGVAGIFVLTSNGSLDIGDVRGTGATIPAINAGPFVTGSLAEAVALNTGTLTFSPQLSDFGFCTGSYLGNRWVVTAAHCVSDLNGTLSNLANEISVTVGVNDLSSSRAKSEAIRVDQVVVSPSYRFDASRTIRDDWALLRLSAEPASGDAISVATAANLDTARNQAGAVTVMGWGWLTRYGPGTSQPTRPSNPEQTSTLQHANIRLASTAECNQGFLRFNNTYQGGDRSLLHVMGDAEICHASENFDANVCHGDSGGPSVISVNGELQLVGATSWGPGPGCAYGFDGAYAVSTSLSHIAGTLSSQTGFNVLAAEQAVAPEGGSSSSGGGGGSASWLGLLSLLAIAALRRRARHGDSV